MHQWDKCYPSADQHPLGRCAVKWILFLFVVTGSAPVTPEHHFATTAEFEDRATCEAMLDRFKKLPRYRVDGVCVPSSAEGLSPDTRRDYELRFPPRK
jgi:hypothetical protein